MQRRIPATRLPATDPAGVVRVARRLVEAVRTAGIPHPASPVAGVVTISAGAAAVQPGDNDPGILVTQADAALYRAKARGRNRAEGAETAERPAPESGP